MEEADSPYEQKWNVAVIQVLACGSYVTKTLIMVITSLSIECLHTKSRPIVLAVGDKTSLLLMSPIPRYLPYERLA